ncbi:hypothetical protein Taro_015380 [Colocasia esculenta]|uniref:Late embryogenesis abundant protein LEA-2 subgroup domain-containing protein n=1 Tax=Colocasia esculenta TaxID=4460 RepID=A0A843UL57_COLES|nr:hypothetical protein [Colocasia esculenta]
MSEKEKVKPLVRGDSLRVTASETAVSAEAAGDVEVARRDKPSKRRRCAVRCCACCGVTVVVLGLLVLILALTVFKVKDPSMTMNSVSVDGVQVDLGEQERPVSINATVNADISIKNPNAASFRFRNSTTEFYYKEQKVGVAYAPSGNARAHRTVRMNVTVDVFADRAVPAAFPNLTLGLGFLLAGNPVDIDLRSYTAVKGRVSVWGIYKRNLDIRMNCTMTLVFVYNQSQEVTNKVCKATVK